MAINPAVIQQLPGVEYEVGPSPAEAAFAGLSAGVSGYGDYLAQRQKTRANQMTAVAGALISEGLLVPDEEGDIVFGKNRWKFNPEGTGYKAKKRQLALKKSQQDIALKERKLGEPSGMNLVDAVIRENYFSGVPPMDPLTGERMSVTEAALQALRERQKIQSRITGREIKEPTSRDIKRPSQISQGFKDRVRRFLVKKKNIKNPTDMQIEQWISQNGIDAVKREIGM